MRPTVIMIAGPNGAGKTTASAKLLKARGISIFVNADQIALGLSGLDPDVAAVASGRLMLKRLHELAAERASFAFETTLAARTFAAWLIDLMDSGYHVHVDFFWVESADVSVNRVRQRKRSGGHFVEEDVVRRRYVRGLENFFEQYRDIATSWTFWNNTLGGEPIMIATRRSGVPEKVRDKTLWREICATYEK